MRLRRTLKFYTLSLIFYSTPSELAFSLWDFSIHMPSHRWRDSQAVVGRGNQCEGERECVRPVPPHAVVATCSSRLSRDGTCPPLVHRPTNKQVVRPVRK